MLQAAIGRVNARAGEERRKIPERDEKTLIHVSGLIVEVTLRPLSACSTAHNLLQTTGRADVLNLTSAAPGNNHPKLYRRLRPRGFDQSPIPRFKAGSTPEEKQPLLRRPQARRFYSNRKCGPKAAFLSKSIQT